MRVSIPELQRNDTHVLETKRQQSHLQTHKRHEQQSLRMLLAPIGHHSWQSRTSIGVLKGEAGVLYSGQQSTSHTEWTIGNTGDNIDALHASTLFYECQCCKRVSLHTNKCISTLLKTGGKSDQRMPNIMREDFIRIRGSRNTRPFPFQGTTQHSRRNKTKNNRERCGTST